MSTKLGCILTIILGIAALFAGVLQGKVQPYPTALFISATNSPVATPTLSVGQLVTVSGRLFVTVADFTGEPIQFLLVDDKGNRFE